MDFSIDVSWTALACTFWNMLTLVTLSYYDQMSIHTFTLAVIFSSCVLTQVAKAVFEVYLPFFTFHSLIFSFVAAYCLHPEPALVRVDTPQQLVLAFIFTFYVFVLSRPCIKRHGEPLRQPRGTLPLAGYGPWFLRPRHTLLTWFASLAPRMGLETYELPVPSLPPAVLVNDPAVLEQVLRDDGRTFVKGAFFRERSADLFRDGILNADGPAWKTQRKAGLRFLSKGNLRRFVDDVLPELLGDLVGRLDRAATTVTADEGIVDLQQELLELTTRFMGRVAYGMEMSGDMPFSRAFDYASTQTGYRFTNPLWWIKEWFYGSDLRAAISKVHGFGNEIVAAAKEHHMQRESDSKAGWEDVGEALQTNLIDSLLEHIPSTETVAAAATNFLSAGRDTTAQSMTWTIYCLLKHPKKLERLRQSLHAAFPDRRADEALVLSFDDVSNPDDQPYLSAVFAETLRLCPPIPLEIKETTDEVTLVDGTQLPKGAVIIWMPYAMARNPSIWGSDAGNFRPERWIDGLKEETSFRYQNGVETRQSGSVDFSDAKFLYDMKSAFENPVFNAGPRMCIGKRLAEMLANVVISALVWSFEFEKVRDGQEVNGERVAQDSLTLPMQGGLPVRVKKRALH